MQNLFVSVSGIQEGSYDLFPNSEVPDIYDFRIIWIIGNKWDNVEVKAVVIDVGSALINMLLDYREI